MHESSGPAHITQLLHEWQGGSQAAFDRLVPMVHGELRTLASRQPTTQEIRNPAAMTAFIAPGLPDDIN